MMSLRIALAVLFLSIGIQVTESAVAQNVSQDTTVKALHGGVSQSDSTTREMVFDIIEVQGNVQKPGVIIIPKRLEPELEEVDLERSFKKEVRDGVGEIRRPEKELQKVDQIESIKKTVARKRK